MDFQDRTVTCSDCKNDFVFTAGEQEFFAHKGFREIPKRCKPCRDSRKQRRVDGYGDSRDAEPREPPRSAGASSGPGPAAGGGHPPREMFDAVCASCGAPARVPFRPATGRPVYCRECYTSRQGQGSGYGGGY